jgi:WD40 repeat protein
VRVYDLDTGKEQEVYKGHHGPVHCVSYSPDGEVYGSGSEDGQSLNVAECYEFVTLIALGSGRQARSDFGRPARERHTDCGNRLMDKNRERPMEMARMERSRRTDLRDRQRTLSIFMCCIFPCMSTCRRPVRYHNTLRLITLKWVVRSSFPSGAPIGHVDVYHVEAGAFASTSLVASSSFAPSKRLATIVSYQFFLVSAMTRVRSSCDNARYHLAYVLVS